MSRKDDKGRVLRKGELQRKSDGKYIYVYTDPLGKRRYIYSNSIETLREREAKLQKDQLDGLMVYASGNGTLNDLVDRYMKTKTELRATTRANYQYMYDHFVRENFGKRKLESIKYSDVLSYYQHLITQEKLKINTLDSIHTVLHPAFQMAVRDDLIRNNPSDGVMAQLKKQPGKNHGIRHALTIEQQTAFINYIENSDEYFHWMPLFRFLLGTGCRIGEAIGIRWQDVDMENRIININHSLVYYSREYKEHSICSFAVSLPKTEAGIRTIPMLDSVYEALKLELEDQEKYGFNDTVIDGMTGFIFMNRFGNVHNPQTVNRAIKRIREAYNAQEIIQASRQNREPVLLPNFSCHHLRHTFCTRLCENETNLKVIQSVMGHANIETTMDIYAEATDEKKQESFKELSKRYTFL